jgi:WXXGXW repeat (2 copies)
MREINPTGERIMFMRKVVVCTAIALSSIALPAAAQTVISIGVAPPAPRYEVVPAPRAGYVWGPGYWNYQNQKHVWTEGKWQEERRGSTWVANSWVEKDGRYSLEGGRWERNK